MTDEIDTMRDALRAATPSPARKARGIDGAMAAFDAEFSADDEKNAAPIQGSDAGRRLTSRKARTGRAEPRRRKMSKLSSLTMAVGGTGIAAVLALFVVMQNGGDRPFTLGPWADQDMFGSAPETAELTVPEPLAEAAPSRARDDAKAAQGLREEVIVTGQLRRQAVESETDVAQFAPSAPAPINRVAVPGKTATIQTRVVDTPASVRRVAVPGKTATIQTRARQVDGASIGSTVGAATNSGGDQSAAVGAVAPRTYSLARVAVPGKTATIAVEIVQPDGSVRTEARPIILEDPSPNLQILPGAATRGGTIVAPTGYRLQIDPAEYETETKTITTRENHDGTPLATRTVQKRRVVKPAKPIFVPLDPEAGLAPIPFDPKVHTISPQEAQMRDRFANFTPNPVIASRETPVSTFSIDVDTVSYSYLRRALNGGQIPPARAIRVEELINYFPYDYPSSDSADEPFKANVTVMPTPWNADTQLMHIGIKGYVPPAAERPRSNIVLLIDTSGSMNAPDKLPLLINSFRLLLDTLDEDDTVSIVTYAGSAGTVLEPTSASERTTIEQAFDRLRAGGSTAGAAGLRLAYNKAQESFDAEAVNRVILATDGDFNVGFSSPEAMKEYVEKKRETGVFLSVLGFGQGNYNDALMQALAQNGNGVAAYIDTLSEARKVLAGEAGGALVPIAKDVKIQVEFNPATISEYRLIGYETRALNRRDFNDDKVDAGDINSGHTVTAIYEITPAGSPAETIDPLRYGAEPLAASQDAGDELAFVKIRHKLPDSDTSTLQTRPVMSDEAVETLNAADAEARFAIAVAAVGQKLQGISALSDYAWDDAIALANGAKSDDPFGYRAEFVGLARLAKSLDARR